MMPWYIHLPSLYEPFAFSSFSCIWFNLPFFHFVRVGCLKRCFAFRDASVKPAFACYIVSFSLSLGCWYFFVKFHNFELFLPCGIIVSLTRIKSIHGCLVLYISLIMVKVAKFQQISYHDLITQWPSLSQHD